MLASLHSGPIDLQVHLGGAPRHDGKNGVKIEIRKLSFWYGERPALKGVSMTIYDREVTAFIGSSASGKTTLLRCLNRANDPDIVPGVRMEGTILLDSSDIYAADLDPPLLRRRFGWVAQKPNPFPSSIYTNVAYGARIHGLVRTRAESDELVEGCLQRVGLWDEVKDRLGDAGSDLSGGQQQRLCIARAIATQPDVILMDEPASALDPGATARIENLIDQLREHYTIVIVTHNMQQAARVAQRVAVFHLGRLIEHGDTSDIFLRPQNDLTESFVTGRFG